MSYQTPRRSARAAAKTPSVAESTVSRRTAISQVGARAKTPRQSNHLPVIATQPSSSYGSNGTINIAHNQRGGTKDFTKVFNENIQTALERDHRTRDPRDSSAAPSVNTFAQDDTITGISGNDTSASITDDVSKSFGRGHEGGLLDDFTLPGPPRVSAQPKVTRVIHRASPPKRERRRQPSTGPSVATTARYFAYRGIACIRMLFPALAAASLLVFLAISGFTGGIWKTATFPGAASNVSQQAVSGIFSEVSRLRELVLPLIPRVATLESKIEDHQLILNANSKKIDEQLKNLPLAQLEAIKKSNIIKNAEFSMRTINWFSPSYGPSILPRLTSTTKDRNEKFWPGVYASMRGIKTSNSPKAALEKWQEPGDCWCAAASTDGKGKPDTGKAQLGVDIQYWIFPQAVTIEHIPKEGTLNIQSAPKEIEIWAQIANPDHMKTIETIRNENPHQIKTCGSAPYQGYACIGKFNYDINALNHVQTVSMDIDLEEHNISTRRIVVRVTENWGGDWTCLYRVQMHGNQAKTNLRPWQEKAL